MKVLFNPEKTKNDKNGIIWLKEDLSESKEKEAVENPKIRLFFKKILKILSFISELIIGLFLVLSVGLGAKQLFLEIDTTQKQWMAVIIVILAITTYKYNSVSLISKFMKKISKDEAEQKEAEKINQLENDVSEYMDKLNKQ